jgi:hypothetical protein
VTRVQHLWTKAAGVGALGLLMLLSLPFAFYAARFGVRGLTSDLSAESYLYTGGQWLPNLALFTHMVGGAVITVLVPVQLYTGLRGRLMRSHRWAGRLIVLLSLTSALGGLTFIAVRGTIGGRLMDVGFAIYGLCLAVAAARTLGYARLGEIAHHREWALRLFVLTFASWLFRLHYVIWFLITDGLGSTPNLTGPFDRVQVFAFFVPYLIALEIYLRQKRRPADRVAKT